MVSALSSSSAGSLTILAKCAVGEFEELTLSGEKISDCIGGPSREGDVATEDSVSIAVTLSSSCGVAGMTPIYGTVLLGVSGDTASATCICMSDSCSAACAGECSHSEVTVKTCSA